MDWRNENYRSSAAPRVLSRLELSVCRRTWWHHLSVGYGKNCFSQRSTCLNSESEIVTTNLCCVMKRTRRCLHKFSDEGVSGVTTSHAISNDDAYHCIGYALPIRSFAWPLCLLSVSLIFSLFHNSAILMFITSPDPIVEWSISTTPRTFLILQIQNLSNLLWTCLRLYVTQNLIMIHKYLQSQQSERVMLSDWYI